MAIRLTDLSPSARAQVEAAMSKSGDKPKRKRPKGGTDVFDGWCYRCKERIVGSAAMDRHRTSTGHARFECWPPPLLETPGDEKPGPAVPVGETKP